MGKTRSKGRGREFWLEVLARFERSSSTQKAFCRREKLNLSSFQYWLYRIRDERAADATARFVEVEARHGAPNDACVIRFGDVSAEFSSTPDVEYMVRLLSSMRVRRR